MIFAVQGGFWQWRQVVVGNKSGEIKTVYSRVNTTSSYSEFIRGTAAVTKPAGSSCSASRRAGGQSLCVGWLAGCFVSFMYVHVCGSAGLCETHHLFLLAASILWLQQFCEVCFLLHSAGGAGVQHTWKHAAPGRMHLTKLSNTLKQSHLGTR